MGQGISLKSERNNPWLKPWLKPWFNINCVCLVISCLVIYILTAECWPLSYLFQREHSILEFIKKTIRMFYFPSSSAAPSTVESEIIRCALLSIPLLLSLCWKLLSLENPFEFNWNTKSSFEIWKFNRNLKFFLSFLFQSWTLRSGAMRVYSSLSCGKFEWLNTCTLHHSAGFMFEIYFQTGQTFFRFRLNFKILKLYLRFQINSNRFSRDRSFGH